MQKSTSRIFNLFSNNIFANTTFNTFPMIVFLIYIDQILERFSYIAYMASEILGADGVNQAFAAL